jgi:hypothetical protein
MTTRARTELRAFATRPERNIHPFTPDLLLKALLRKLADEVGEFTVTAAELDEAADTLFERFPTAYDGSVRVRIMPRAVKEHFDRLTGEERPTAFSLISTPGNTLGEPNSLGWWRALAQNVGSR